MPRPSCLWFACLVAITAHTHAATWTAHLGVVSSGAQQEEFTWRAVYLVRGDGPAQQVRPEIEVTGGRLLRVIPEEAPTGEGRSAIFFVELAGDSRPGAAAPQLTIGLSGATETRRSCPLPLAIDLEPLRWEAWFQGEGSSLDGVSAPPAGEHPWRAIRVPGLIDDLGVTWFRTRVLVPVAWRGQPLRLHLSAIDDNDATFLNGRPVGRTTGWDVPRSYLLPDDAVRWGEENEIVVTVDNVNAGGGIYQSPLWLLCGPHTPCADQAPDQSSSLPPVHVLFDDSARQEESDRAPAGALGPRLPLRAMEVRDGVLYYADGGEVALWGVNYYPQSWMQYESLRKAGIDPRRSIDEDFADFRAMGIDSIRIHVFDTEISDSEGNLVANDHLDVLDYLVARCNESGIYLMLTPIAWWGSPSSLPESFSRLTAKQAMSQWPDRWAPQARYLRQFLAHTNPYTGRRLIDEPCLALMEIINEPTYWTLDELRGLEPGWIDGATPEADARGRAGVRQEFGRFVPDASWQTPVTYKLFRYETLRRYIDAMIEAVRSTGARQPIAYFANPWRATDDVFQAVAESRCEAITLGAYPGGLPQEPVNDAKNLLAEAGNVPLDARLAGKARLVYEFDASGTIDSVVMYPALARHWRNRGVQVAHQFQYDARALAALNREWPQHYLNLWHTPEKAASFLIAAEAFRRIPRGAAFPTPEDDQVFSPAAVSFARNAALLAADDVYMQARPTDWRPLPLPDRPARVLAVGTNRYFAYEGTGLVELRIEGEEARLCIRPDVERLQRALHGTPEQPLTQLVERSHPMRIKLPGWENARVERKSGDGWQSLGTAREFPATPGEYRLTP